jgi:hypothetical protein
LPSEWIIYFEVEKWSDGSVGTLENKHCIALTTYAEFIWRAKKVVWLNRV